MAISSIERAFDLLFLLYRNEEEMGISEISRELDLQKSTVHRTLKTLEEKGMVRKNEVNDKYWLGMKLYTMGALVGEKLSIKKVIEPYAKELCREFNEVVNVSVLDLTNKSLPRSIMIHKETGLAKRLSVNPDLGSSSDCYNSSVGKCLLAFNDVDLSIYSDDSIIKYTENTIASWDDLSDHLKIVKEQGYAMDHNELEIGLTCLGAPILNSKGNAIAAISISGPTQRIYDDNLDGKIEKLLEITNRLSEEFR